MLVTQFCPTLCELMDCSLSGSSVCGIFQARILGWVIIPFSRGSSWPRDWTGVCCIAGRFLTLWAMREALLKCIYQTINRIYVSRMVLYLAFTFLFLLIASYFFYLKHIFYFKMLVYFKSLLPTLKSLKNRVKSVNSCSLLSQVENRRSNGSVLSGQ